MEKSSISFNLVNVKATYRKNHDTVLKAFNAYRKIYPDYKRITLYDVVAKQVKLSPRTIRRIITSKKHLILSI